MTVNVTFHQAQTKVLKSQVKAMFNYFSYSLLKVRKVISVDD